MQLKKPFARGNTADLYLYDNKAVKVFHNRVASGEAAREAHKQQIAHSQGLPVPRVLAVTSIGGREAIVMEHSEGVSIGELMQRDMTQAQACLSLAVEIQLQVHAKAAPGLEPMRERLAWKIRAARLLEESHRKLLLELLDRTPFEQRLCHGDFHIFNLLRTRDGVTVIDWADATAGSPGADACRSYVLYKEHSEELAELYLGLFCRESGRSREEILAWLPIIAGARLSEGLSAKQMDCLLEMVRRSV